jgi:hypothetical protein
MPRFLVILLLAGISIRAQNNLHISGYIRELPLTFADRELRNFSMDNILHNRLNIRWDIHENFTFHGGQRSRFFWGGMAENPAFREFLRQDQGILPFSHLLYHEKNRVIHTITDRFFFDWQKGNWQVRLGRQRINWGINTVTNPNDLFNNYSFFDFDYDERPGADAVRVTYHTGALSRWEVAYSPGITARESVAAVLRSFNKWGYDFQFIGGYFYNRAAVGGGWAGNLRKLGFKGEITYFHDLEPQDNIEPNNIVVAFSLDYRFQNGMFWVSEVVFNQQQGGLPPRNLVLIEPLRADNITFSDIAVFSNLTFPVDLVISVGLAGFYFPNEETVFISPNYTRSLHKNLDLTLLSQLFLGADNSPLTGAGYNLIAMVKWSF